MLSRRVLGLTGLTALATPFILRHAAAQEGRTALDLINRTPAVSYFAEFIKNQGLQEQFSTGQYGYFIPVDAAVERIRELGGTVNQGPMEVPGDQRAVMATDPEGVPFMLVGK